MGVYHSLPKFTLQEFLESTITLREKPFRLLILHPTLTGRGTLRCTLMLTDIIQATPIGGRCRAKVIMSSHPEMWRFVGKAVDVVIKNFDDIVLAVFDFLHVLMIGEITVADTYITVEPAIPRDVFLRTVEGEYFWKKRYDELYAKYQQDLEKIGEEYFKALDGMRRIIQRYAEQVPALSQLAEWFMGIRDASLSAEALSRLVAMSAQAGVAEQTAPPESPEARRRLISRIAEFLRGRR
jgi:hypothetical protein